MDTRQAVASRRSIPLLAPPAPDDRELRELVQLAMTSPDHGGLSPWRLVTVRGDACRALGELFGRTMGANGARRERIVAKALRAPLLIAVVFCPREHHKVLRWEQMAATVCVVSTLILLLHDRGWGSMWRTGPFINDPEVRRFTGLVANEELLGWLYVGTVPGTGPSGPRRRLDARSKISGVSTAGGWSAENGAHTVSTLTATRAESSPGSSAMAPDAAESGAYRS
jgi:nitroreductase